MVAVGTRRTPGLRREEVAVLAGVGVSWYTWLEQGRDITVSAEVIEAIGRTLRLTESERSHLYVLATNEATRTLFGYGSTDHNCLISFFTNARYRSVHLEWESVAPRVVAAFRADAAHFPDDPRYGEIVAELSAVSEEFAALWARHDVDRPGQAVKVVRHPDAGDLHFENTTLVVADRPELLLELYNPRPGTGTADRLERLHEL